MDFKVTLLNVILLIVCLLVLALALSTLKRTLNTDLVVQTKHGKVRGVRKYENTKAWYKVPFAKPPTLENGLRWKAPIDPDPWDNILNLPYKLSSVPEAPQESLITHKPVGTEDCLYLNVIRPDTDETNLPVYCWIFGGGSIQGATWKYPGNRIAAKENVVFVSIGYRLGPFGWLQYEGMDKSTKENASGNFGTLDILKGLQWIQNNIRYFGGNPNNVLLSGESAGAFNALTMVLSPLGKGLFHKLLYESGGLYLRTEEESIANTSRLVTNLKLNNNKNSSLSDKELLETASTVDIIKAYFKTPPRYAGAFRDGHVMPNATVPAIILSGNFNKVPCMIGTNLNETKYLNSEIAQTLKNAHLDPSTGVKSPIPSSKWSYANIPVSMYLPIGPSIWKILPTQNDKDLYNAGNQLASLMWSTPNSDMLATALCKHVDVYVYKYVRQGQKGSAYELAYGACHTAELTPFFGYPEQILSPTGFLTLRKSLGYQGHTKGAKDLSNKMMEYASNFHRHANPNGNGLTPWNKWTCNNTQRMKLDADESNANCEMITELNTLQTITDLRQQLIAKYGMPYVFDTFGSMVEIPLKEWSDALSAK